MTLFVERIKLEIYLFCCLFYDRLYAKSEKKYDVNNKITIFVDSFFFAHFHLIFLCDNDCSILSSLK